MLVAACGDQATDVTELETPDPTIVDNVVPGAPTEHTATYKYSEKCKDLASVQCTLNISSAAGHSASEHLQCINEFASCTATIVGGVTGSCDAGDRPPRDDVDFTVLVKYNNALQFPPTLTCYSGT